MSILVIGTNHRNRITYATALAGSGYDVEEARTFEEAENLLAGGLRPRTVVIDVRLHPEKARDFITTLKPGTGVIVVSGDETVRSPADLGAHLLFRRPVSADDLIRGVSTVLQ